MEHLLCRRLVTLRTHTDGTNSIRLRVSAPRGHPPNCAPRCETRVDDICSARLQSVPTLARCDRSGRRHRSCSDWLQVCAVLCCIAQVLTVPRLSSFFCLLSPVCPLQWSIMTAGTTCWACWADAPACFPWRHMHDASVPARKGSEDCSRTTAAVSVTSWLFSCPSASRVVQVSQTTRR
jgi:hypothetical protein